MSTPAAQPQLQQLSVYAVMNFLPFALNITFTDVPKNPETYTAGAAVTDGPVTVPGGCSPGQSVPVWDDNNSDFANHNIQVPFGRATDSPLAIYIWQHGNTVYWSKTVPSGYTTGTILIDAGSLFNNLINLTILTESLITAGGVPPGGN